MDPGVVAAIVGGAAGLGGTGLGLLVGRKQRAATVELTEDQAEEIRAKIWRQLNDDLRAEIIRLQGRITDLETRLASLDLALREKTAELAATQAERDALRTQLAVAQASLAEREREIGDLKAIVAGAAPAP